MKKRKQETKKLNVPTINIPTKERTSQATREGAWGNSGEDSFVL